MIICLLIPAKNKLKSLNSVVWALCLCLVVSFISPAGYTSPQPKGPLIEYQASYNLTWHGLPVGESQHVISKIADNHYLAIAQSYPLLAFVPFDAFEQSEFKVEKDNIIPLCYQYLERKKGKRKEGSILFDWRHKIVEKKAHGKPTEKLPLAANSYDKITYLFQLQQDLRAGKKTFQYLVQEENKIQTYTFTLKGTEIIKTPLGKFETLKLEHISANKERKTELWLAPKLDYLMLKLRQARKGKMQGEAIIYAFSP